MISGKAWGATQLIFKNENFEVHRIDIMPNCFCSKHKHEYKHNIFYIEEGLLFVKVWKKDYDLIDITSLEKGQMMDVSPGEFHQFSTQDKPVVAYEIYYSKPIGGDIIRETCGGRT